MQTRVWRYVKAVLDVLEVFKVRDIILSLVPAKTREMQPQLLSYTQPTLGTMCFYHCIFYTCNHRALGAIVQPCTESFDQAGVTCPQRQPHPLHTIRREVDCDDCKVAKKRADAVYSDMNLTLSKTKDLLRQLRERVERRNRKGGIPAAANELARRVAQPEKPYFETMGWNGDSEASGEPFPKGWIHAHNINETQTEVATGVAVDAPGSRCTLRKDERYVGGTCIESSSWAENLRITLRDSRNISSRSASPRGPLPCASGASEVPSEVEGVVTKKRAYRT
ncbi:hypothetical protein GQ53DRAFT_97681 [Thozetella sp. PMI_491]|nr:hypothetical protein GQ53DRAFT_97681 [Thozetella sp. PMI_491]